MNALLIRFLVKGARPDPPSHVRLQCGLLAGFAGIAANLALFAVKLVIGLVSGSVAVAADAVNNLSDAGNSLITVLGFRFSALPADNEHPFGHGRLEYVAALVVAVIIMAVGLDLFKESAMRIFHPSPTVVSNAALIALGAVMLVKVWLFCFYRVIARWIKSQVVRAAAFDSLSDLLASGMVILAVWLGRYTAFPIDGCMGVGVAILVIWGGGSILRDTVNPLLGECPDKALVNELRTRLLACPEIRGIHDIIIHNYGPNRYFATAHAEVDKIHGDVLAMHDILENAEVAIARAMPVRLVLHCDPFDSVDPVVKIWRVRVEEIAHAFDANFKVYDFRVNPDEHPPVLHFHLLIPRNYALSGEVLQEYFTRKLRAFDPGVVAHIDFINGYV